MTKYLLVTALATLSVSAFAADLPSVGLLAIIPVNDGPKVVARPTYILTREKLSAPAIFSGLQESFGSVSVICCFRVSDVAPINFKNELARYARYPEFAEYYGGVKGYRYVYTAVPVPDRTQWTPLMTTIMDNASDPEDGSPFTAPVIAATFGKARMPATFKLGEMKVKLVTSYKNPELARHVFQLGTQTVEFSEPTSPH